MPYKDFMNKVRYWDNLTARWILRHFYFMFFQIVLVVAFLIWFVTTINVIDLGFQIKESSINDRFSMILSVNSLILVFLVLLNSFWLLFLFNGMQRMIGILKDMSYNISRLRANNRN